VPPSYPLKDYSNNEMALGLAEQLARGKHKSAQQCCKVFTALKSTNVKHGYSFCLREDALSEIASAVVAPHSIDSNEQ
jgi:hypothetical protein